MEFKERFAKVLQVMGTNASRLSREVGGTTSKYYKLLKGESEPNLETIVSLLKRYPEISADWLLVGEGEMLKKDASDVSKLKKENERLRNDLELQSAIVAKLVGKPKATTQSLLIDREVPENRMLAPKHISVFCQEIIDRLIATYGFYRFPSVN